MSGSKVQNSFESSRWGSAIVGGWWLLAVGLGRKMDAVGVLIAYGTKFELIRILGGAPRY